MKAILLIIFLFSFQFIFGQDSITWKKSKINIELGTLSSVFFSNHTGKRFNRNQNNDYHLSYIKLGFSKKRMTVFFDVMEYYEINETGSTPQNPVIVDSSFILGREYLVLNLGFSYSFFVKKLKLLIEPCAMISHRRGEERLASWLRTGHLPMITYHQSIYKYESYGLGLGLNLRKPIFKGLYIGASGYFQHFFQERKVIQERYNTYKYNKTMFSPMLKIGYEFKL